MRGGAVRGIVAHKKGYRYVGIDIRQEQIDANIAQCQTLLPENNQPEYIVGNSDLVLDSIKTEFDFIFSCPPYADLEVYSDLEGDISNMKYDSFLIAYESIINKSCALLKTGQFACFVVSEVRDKHGYYYGFVADTIKIFQRSGLKFYNDAVLLNVVGASAVRCSRIMGTKKLTKVHQNVLVFKKI